MTDFTGQYKKGNGRFFTHTTKSNLLLAYDVCQDGFAVLKDMNTRKDKYPVQNIRILQGHLLHFK
jgi:hypothetical protein